jgi:hypothetical protein
MGEVVAAAGWPAWWEGDAAERRHIGGGQCSMRPGMAGTLTTHMFAACVTLVGVCCFGGGGCSHVSSIAEKQCVCVCVCWVGDGAKGLTAMCSEARVHVEMAKSTYVGSLHMHGCLTNTGAIRKGQGKGRYAQ